MDLGQNFLVNPGAICPRIVSLLGENDRKNILEIGTGHGELTSELLKVAKKVVSVEIDEQLFKYSSAKFLVNSNLELINSDFMNLDLPKFLDEKFGSDARISVCANIPYYITTQIVMKLLESERFSFVALMVQKEAAKRIVCPPGNKNCGAISVTVRYYSAPKYAFDVSKNCFNPRPKVDSAVITFETLKRDNIKNREIFFDVVRASFSKRRKNILNSISSGLKISRDKIFEILKEIGIDRNKRAENLTFENFVDISNLMSEKNF